MIDQDLIARQHARFQQVIKTFDAGGLAL